MAGYLTYRGVSIRVYLWADGRVKCDVGTERGADGLYCAYKHFDSLEAAQAYVDSTLA